ncbi:GDP-mannose mannosyl hydrolase [Dechloromonas sp. ARDL1]|uniref:GDP-mannose mannosyl hydrolase n=1 Tax=Dechloromonas sp. ARDL1 TaxID=3322121 RepID=UPI003DA79611
MLDRQAFLSVVDRTALVSVDLIVVRDASEVLLGLRKNRPAKDVWFVPGGRIFKNEKIADALIRVAGSELGLGEEIRHGTIHPKPIGCFEHFYPDCFAEEPRISTHYVVLGHLVEVPHDFRLPAADTQHATFRWWPIEEAAAARDVHQYTKDYLVSAYLDLKHLPKLAAHSPVAVSDFPNP